MHEAFTYQLIEDKPPLEVSALCSYGIYYLFIYLLMFILIFI